MKSHTGDRFNLLSQSLTTLGIRPGDTVFFHVSLDMLGVTDSPETAGSILAALRGALGEAGTILVPTYTFSFCNQRDFDVRTTPTEGGPWSTSAAFLEHVRLHNSAVRSRDPIHSVAGIGPDAKRLLENVPNTCFGPGSIYDRLLQAGGKICTIGVGLNEATFRHYVEEIVGVPFRYKKLFTGSIREGDREYKTGWVYNVRILADNGFPDGTKLEQMAKRTGVARSVMFAGGEITLVTSQDYYDLCRQELTRDPWTSARGPAGDPVALEEARIGAKRINVSLPPDASMEQMVGSLWALPRDIVSDGYDAALSALAAQMPMTIHQYPSGTECWSWIVPEKWTCHEAYLETLDGKRLFSYADNPLHVVSYSLPFEGVVTREVLLTHLHVHPHLPDAVPFNFKYYERDWGLCCSRELRDSLQADRYKVTIRTSFSFGTLKVGEIIAPGLTDETIMLCAHLCHPAMVNDDLSGVAVGMSVMRELLRRKDLRFTYRFIIVPETIGSVAYLSHNEHLIPNMKGGLFLEMLGLDNPHALQLSFKGDTVVDHAFVRALKASDPSSWTGEFRTIIGNDERQFNAPGIRVPMLSLSRVLHGSDPVSPYLEYHSSKDAPERASFGGLRNSRDTVLAMLDALEHATVPVNLYKGEPFCSRYGLHIDAYTNPEGHRALFDILFLIDGNRSVDQIAEICGISTSAVAGALRELKRFGLVDYHGS